MRQRGSVFHSLHLASAVAVCLFFTHRSPSMAAEPESVEFNRDVRPILSNKCFACHGPDAETREADLRLDRHEGAVRDLGGHAAVVPGDVAASLLIARITTDDADAVMPPHEFDKPITKEETQIIKQWIASGAAYEDHWSFAPIRRPRVPDVSAATRNAIDAFVEQQIAASGITANSQADARTLVRRLSFDTTGLPPDAKTVEAFRADPTDERYAQIVESYLASPHYGERMAMYWLDLVRYADTLGYHGDQDRSVSPYRDYVVKAFNANKPFDVFTTEQLAGDLLPNATLSQKVASTYNRLNRASAEGGVQPKEYLAKYSADRVRTLGSVWLGATVGCAECHDHKFDPFSTHDFYSFAAFFADIKELGIVSGANHLAVLPVPTPEQAAEQGRLKAQLDLARAEYKRDDTELRAEFERWTEHIQAVGDLWQPLRPTEVASKSGTTLTVADDAIVTASGETPTKDTYSFSIDEPVATPPTGKSSIALRLEVLTDESLPQKGPGRAGNGNFVVNAVNLKLAGENVKWTTARSTHDQNGFPAADLVKSTKGWAVLPKTGQSHELILIGQLKSGDASVEKPAIEVEIVQNHGTQHTVGRFRVSVAWADDIDLEATTDPALLAIAKTASAERTPKETKTITDAFRKSTPMLAEVRKRIANLEQREKDLTASIVTTLGTSATEPRDIRVLPRGDWMNDSGKVVEPNVPAFLPSSLPAGNARNTRLDLANWLTSSENPMVARAFVNRLWMLYFGHGLARNVDDLGSQGDVPTHPQLLDWLAAEFIDSGWDIKHMIRLMLMSDTYRRSSHASAELRQSDPLNRLYARQSRYRLEAEMVRDNALAVSGLLDSTIGGKSVKPYQPPGYWAQLNFPKRTYQHDAGPSQYRRGLYTHWQRTFLHPSLMAFDAPAREECTAQRPRSNTPLQSLVLLNDPTFVESARVLAQRVLLEGKGSFDQRVDWLYLEVLAREVRDNERPLLEQLYSANRTSFAADAEAVDALLKTGLAPVPAECDRVEVAAWTAVARAVLNLHETITRY